MREGGFTGRVRALSCSSGLAVKALSECARLGTGAGAEDLERKRVTKRGGNKVGRSHFRPC